MVQNGSVDLVRLLDAINSLPDDGARQRVVAALKEHDTETRYYTMHDGRVDAAKVR